MSVLDDEFPMMMEREAGMPENIPMVGVGFGMHPMKDNAASEKAGHDVFKDVEHVKIAIPGDRGSLYFQPATEVHRKRFPKAYASYKQRETKTVVHGMPIEMWAPITRSQAMTLRAANIPTVEALAEVHDGFIDKIGSHGRELREKAKAFLAQARDGAAAMKEASEKQKLQDQIKALQAQITALSEGKPIKAPTEAPVVPEPKVDEDVEQAVVAAVRKPRARRAADG